MMKTFADRSAAAALPPSEPAADLAGASALPVLAPAQPPVQPEVAHATPSEGGSYTRNVETGELVRNEPAPVDQPVQE